MGKPLVIRVPGAPVGKQRPRMGKGGHVYTPAETRQYEQKVQWLARAEMAREKRQPIEANVKVWVHAYVADHRRRDIDNLVKAAQDALNQIVFVDDSQIVELHGYKRVDKDNPRLEITVEVADDRGED